MEDITKQLTIQIGSRRLGCLVLASAITFSPLFVITSWNVVRGYLGRTRVDLLSGGNRRARFIAGTFHNPRSLVIRDRNRIDQIDLHFDYLGDREDIPNRHYDFLFKDPKPQVDFNLRGLAPGRYNLQIFTRDAKGNEHYREMSISEDQTI